MVFTLLVLLGAAAAWYYFGDGNENQVSAADNRPVRQAGLAVAADTPRASVPTKSEVEALVEKGRAALQAGDAKAAQDAFSDALKRFPSSPSSADAAIELSKIYAKAGDTANTRSVLAYSAAGLPDGDARRRVVGELNRINSDAFFSRTLLPGSVDYVVQRGDSLYKIGQRYRITARYIMRMNGHSSDRINIGEHLKVIQGPLDAVIEKSKYRLTVYLNGAYVKEYRIGLGKDNSTPAGEFTVQNKLVDPTWDPPGPEFAASKAPDNPLGTRWIGFNRDYGIHGTIEPQSIGTQASRGCVRMINGDVEEVYDLLVEGSKVTVKP